MWGRNPGVWGHPGGTVVQDTDVEGQPGGAVFKIGVGGHPGGTVEQDSGVGGHQDGTVVQDTGVGGHPGGTGFRCGGDIQLGL